MKIKMIFPENIRWIKHFLTNRWVEIDSEGQTISRRLSNYLPQMDVLSLLLFNIYTSDCHTINAYKINLIQYADDFALIESGITIPELKHKLQRSLNQLAEMLAAHKLNISLEKTKVMTFTKDNNYFNMITKEVPIERVKSHRFLGIDSLTCYLLTCYISFSHIKLNNES